MNIQRALRKLDICYSIFRGSLKPSFSQFGEDRILESLFTDLLKINHPSYIDIGANHPIYGNNTYGFYFRGSKGILIEPDPYLFSLLKKERKNDTLLNAGIGLSTLAEENFYVYPKKFKGLNTFSAKEAELRKKEGISYEKIIQMPLLNINTVICNNFKKPPDFLSIDVEGLDFEIIKSLDFKLSAPKVICLETIRFGNTKEAGKTDEMIEYVLSKGYFVYADTYVNTIFCQKNLFQK